MDGLILEGELVMKAIEKSMAFCIFGKVKGEEK